MFAIAPNGNKISNRLVWSCSFKRLTALLMVAPFLIGSLLGTTLLAQSSELSSVKLKVTEAADQAKDTFWGEQTANFGAKDVNTAKLFKDGNYAMFIHWGMYSKLAGEWKG